MFDVMMFVWLLENVFVLIFVFFNILVNIDVEIVLFIESKVFCFFVVSFVFLVLISFNSVFVV